MSGESEEDLAEFLGLTERLNEKQRTILHGVIDVLATIDEDAAAMRWLERNRQRLVDELQRAG